MFHKKKNFDAFLDLKFLLHPVHAQASLYSYLFIYLFLPYSLELSDLVDVRNRSFLYSF